MKNRKRRAEPFSFYDHTGIEHHLTEMARKGWMIERITNQFWTYRKMEPRELHFAVTYYPKANDFAPEPSERQKIFYDFCAKTGWAFACSWFQMQIFYNASDHPVPMDTDPVYEVETIHKACKANFLWAYGILLAVGAVGTYFFYSGLMGHTLYFFSRPSSMVTYPCLLLLFLLSAVELAAYYSWYHKAVKLAKDGIFLDTPSTAEFQKGILIFGLCPILSFWAVNLFSAENPLMAVLSLLMFSVVFGAAAFTDAVKQYLKRKRAKSWLNRTLTFGSAFLATFFLMGCIIAAGLLLSQSKTFSDPITIEEPPLKVENLTQTSYPNYITLTEQDASLLLGRLETEQRRDFEDAPSPEVPEMQYELYQVKLPWLYDFFERQMLRIALLGSGDGAYLTEADAASFGADRAYRLAAKDGTLQNRYILCYPDHLVDIEFSWTLTEEQIHLAGNALKP